MSARRDFRFSPSLMERLTEEADSLDRSVNWCMNNVLKEGLVPGCGKRLRQAHAEKDGSEKLSTKRSFRLFPSVLERLKIEAAGARQNENWLARVIVDDVLKKRAAEFHIPPRKFKR